MTRDVVTVTEDTTIDDVLDLFSKYHYYSHPVVTDTGKLTGAGLFTFLVVVMALAEKLIGGFIGSRIVGFDSHDSLIFGVGVMPGAGIELVVISVGRGMGIIDCQVFSAIVLMVAVFGSRDPCAFEACDR